jgi:hypothetical protein
MVPQLTEAEPRLRRRYDRLVVAHVRNASPLAAGLHALPEVAQPLAATQAAWRFYANPRLTLPQLVQPLRAYARQALAARGPGMWGLVVHDWSWLPYQSHRGKKGRVVLGHRWDRGYELLSSLLVDDQQGAPLAVVSQGLRDAAGWHGTGEAGVRRAGSSLDDLTRQMQEAAGLGLGRPLVHIIDREADSVDPYRRWEKAGHRFLVRADDQPRVRYQGQVQALRSVAKKLRRAGGLRPQASPVMYHGVEAWRWVGEATVTLERPALRRQKVNGQVRQRTIAGPPLTLRLVVCEVRDAQGRRLARWLLLSNLPAAVPAETVALWYYWRWRIESYFKLLKQAGQQVESWQQETAESVARRLLVATGGGGSGLATGPGSPARGGGIARPAGAPQRQADETRPHGPGLYGPGPPGGAGGALAHARFAGRSRPEPRPGVGPKRATAPAPEGQRVTCVDTYAPWERAG